MALPQFLLVDDSYANVQTFVALIRRIGLINTVRPVGTIAEAQALLEAAAPAALPVVIFAGESIRDGDGDTLFAWLDEQGAPVDAIPTVSLDTPLEMYAIIDALKALALPERARIDTTTLTVRVELWPHGTILTEA